MNGKLDPLKGLLEAIRRGHGEPLPEANDGPLGAIDTDGVEQVSHSLFVERDHPGEVPPPPR